MMPDDFIAKLNELYGVARAADDVACDAYDAACNAALDYAAARRGWSRDVSDAASIAYDVAVAAYGVACAAASDAWLAHAAAETAAKAAAASDANLQQDNVIEAIVIIV